MVTRFEDTGFEDYLISEQENKSTMQIKTERNAVKLLQLYPAELSLKVAIFPSIYHMVNRQSFELNLETESIPVIAEDEAMKNWRTASDEFLTLL